MMLTFQGLIKKLLQFWEETGCVIHQGYDLEVGAGTFNPTTFLRSLGPEPYNAVYIEPSRRPQDGRYGDNPNRLHQHHQLQVMMKPSPFDIQDLYLKSLEAIGFNPKEHDIRFVHDDWESPTLGAWGLGWEVWMDGMEVTQFTYFQCVGGVDLAPIPVEITYGLERLAMYLQQVDNVYDLKWNDEITYGEIFKRNEFEWSHYSFEKADTKMWMNHFNDYENEAKRLIEDKFPIAAYDFVMKASHAFNMLDARGAISVTERSVYISKIRNLSQLITKSYIESRKEQGFPLLRAEDKKEVKLEEVEFAIPKDATKDDFLLEIGSEELPAIFMQPGCENLKKLIAKLLEENKLLYDKIETFGTPRRLAILVSNLDTVREEEIVEKKGPAVEIAFEESAPTKIGLGFLKSVGMENVFLEDISSGKCNGIEIRDGSIFTTKKTPAISAKEILAKALPKLILDIKFPKNMRWNSLDITYARPLRWIVAMLGKEVIPFQVGNIAAGNQSSGHKQICPIELPIHHPESYVEQLREVYVLVDIEERRRAIENYLNSLDVSVLCKEKVVGQVLNLTEWPMLTIGHFDEKFLDMPKEILISEMVEHQKYFPVEKNDGLDNTFVITADHDLNEQIVHGNERVLSARLNDGVFLYNQDLKQTLDAFNEKLKKMTFHGGIGSVFDKKNRLVAFVDILTKTLNLESKNALRTADLCKADLASELVGEFPELQGTIGKYYAIAQGESNDVAVAIEEHWMPRGEKASLPKSSVGAAVSLADKIDNFICLFCLGKKPTSSSDPFALRRQAIGFIKIVIEHKMRFSIKDILGLCYDKCVAMTSNFKSCDKEKIIDEINSFIINRIKVVFLDYGFSKDEIAASLSSGMKDICDIFEKVRALRQFKEEKPDLFANMCEVYKRAKGQIQNEDKHTLDPFLLTEKEEKDLYQTLTEVEKSFHKALEDENYHQAYEKLSKLQTPLSALFDNVKILADNIDLRYNRIALLQKVFCFFDSLIDFTKLMV